jgi:putative nucleotidyltransferase with HDIG domain
VQAAPVVGPTPVASSGWLSRVVSILMSRPRSAAPITYSTGLVVYVVGICVLAVGAFAATWTGVSDWTGMLVLAAAVFLLGFSSVEVIPGLSIVGNASSLVNLGMAVTFGPVACLLGGFCESMGILARMRSGWFRASFNTANFFLANWAAYMVFSHMVARAGNGVMGLSLAGLSAGAVQYVGPNILLAGVVAIATHSAILPRIKGALSSNWYTIFYGWGAAAFPLLHDRAGALGLTWVLAPMVGTQALLVVFAARVRTHNEVRTQLVERVQEESARVERSYDATLVALTHALDARDRETEGHSRRVVEYTREIATALGVSGSELTTLAHGALLHDIGKIGVPDAILHKPGELTEEEWEIMRRHPQLGAAMVEDIEVLKEARLIILHHHERWDGTGYPKGLRGGQITLGARIFAVADAVDAVTQDRPYRLASSLDRARVELQRNRERQFDPDAVDAFLAVSEERLIEIQRLRTPVNIDVLTYQAAQNQSYLAKSGLGTANLRRRAS